MPGFVASEVSPRCPLKAAGALQKQIVCFESLWTGTGCFKVALVRKRMGGQSQAGQPVNLIGRRVSWQATKLREAL